jgi:uncharacterized protein YneF (UPF0154 family)
MSDRRVLVLLVAAAIVVGILGGAWLFDVLA